MTRRCRFALYVAMVVSLLLAVATIASASTVFPRSEKEPNAQYVPGRIIVAFSSEQTVDPRRNSLDAWIGVTSVTPVFSGIADAQTASLAGSADPLKHVYLVSYAANIDPSEAAESYASQPGVRYAQPDYIRHALRTDPNDPYWPTSNSWGQGYRDQWDMEKIACPAAWDLQQGSASVVVAVSDTGIDYNHADIQANMWHNPSEIPGNGIDDDGNGKIDDYYGYDFANGDSDPLDDNGHGTHCAGTIGAVGNNAVGIAGMNWHCSLMAVKGLDSSGSGSDSDLSAGIVYATDEGANVISMSWGGEGRSQVVSDALEYAHAHNVVLSVAGGNDNDDIVNWMPAYHNAVLTVEASDQTDARCSFSNWGIKSAVSAPGGGPSGSTPPCAQHNCLSLRAGTTDLLSSGCGAGVGIVGTNYYRLAGTSMACPHVSGLAALVLAQHPSWTNEQVRQAIQMRADDILTPGFDRYSGFGRINAYQSVTSPEPMTAYISSPINAGRIWGSITISGMATGPSFSHYILDYGAGYEPGSWTGIATSSTPVTSGTLATWDASGVTSGMYTLRLRTNGSGSVQNAQYRLQVSVSPPQGSGHFTEQFNTDLCDLDNLSITFAPDGSAGYYSACTTPITSLPTDPAGGTALYLTDDSYQQVTLSGGAQVSLYGNLRGSFYIGSNGYVTFDSGDTAYSESYTAHFSKKRISALFDDLDPTVGLVTWKQLADRAVVTYLNVAEIETSNSNTFQIEMYYDGRIVISYLSLDLTDGLAGLSAGTGVPSGFAPTDLTAYSGCAGRLLHLTAPNGGQWYEPGNTVPIGWTATNADWVPTDRVKLEYSSDAGANWTQIPGAESLAYDAGSFNWNTTGLASSDQYRARVVYISNPTVMDGSDSDFTIAPDTVPPVITHTPLADTGNTTGPYTVRATVTDGLGVGAVTLYWSKNGGGFTGVPMTLTPTQYCANIPGPSVVGDSYCYYIEATDVAATPNTARSPATGEHCFDIREGMMALYYADAFMGNDYVLPVLQTLGYDVTQAESWVDFNNRLRIADFSVAVALNQNSSLGADYQTWADYITAGGKMIFADWTSTSDFGTLFGATYTGSDNQTPVTITNPDLAQGIPNPLPLQNPGWGTYSMGLLATGDAESLGHFPDNDDAIIWGNDGQTILLGMLADTLSAQDGQRFFENLLGILESGSVPLHVIAPNGGEYFEPGDTIHIQWDATGTDWQPGDTVRLEYSTDGGISWDPTPIAPGEAYNAGSFDWDTTGVPESSQYRVRVVFNGDTSINDASDANFTIMTDIIPPVITHTPLGDTSNTAGPYAVCATVTDSSGIASVTLYWSRNAGAFASVPMTGSGTPNQYCANIPGPSVVGDWYSYYIEAVDSSMAGNASRSPVTGSYTFSIVVAPDFFTELFDTTSFDLDNLSITFTPDGSAGYYSACATPITNLPTDPTGGTALSLTDDSYQQVTLSGGAQVSLYGNLRSGFYVGSNGYVTFDSGDTSLSESYSSHFSKKRISALFDDLNPPSGSVTWKQLADRAVVTYLNVPEYGPSGSNTFQIEMYFDGKIVVSYLSVAATDGLAGLSAGLGVPADFVESDLSAYPACVPPGRVLHLTAPNGGEWYEPGSTVPIVWTATGADWVLGDMVRLEYSINAGTDWAQISGAENLAYDAGAFNWNTTGLAESDRYRVKVIYNDDASVYDASDGNFNIRECRPPAPSNPIPADGATNVSPATMLSWECNAPGMVIEDFEDGSLSEYTDLGDGTHTIAAAAAHDGNLGLASSMPGMGAGWIYRADPGALVAQGSTVSYWVRLQSSGRSYCGFGASAGGTYSAIAAPNTSTFIIQLNQSYDFADLASTPQVWLYNHWYRIEVQWDIGGLITARLYDSNGASLLNTVSATNSSYTSGGIAFRAFGDSGANYFDTVQRVGSGGMNPPGAATYDVYLGPSCQSMSLICADTASRTCDPPLLLSSTYYWKVVAKNSCGQTPGPCWSFTTLTPAIAKAPIGAAVSLEGIAVSASFAQLHDVFYIENDDRSCGIRVEKPGHGLHTAMRADVAGTLQVNAGGELCIAATSAAQSSPPNDTGDVKPVALNSSVLGGGPFGGQDGVWTWSAGQLDWRQVKGLNNVGLLVTTCGWVTASDQAGGWFYIDDGGGVNNGGGAAGVRIVAPGMIVPPVGSSAEVTGASSCELRLGKLVSLIMPRTQSDIVAVPR